MSCYLGKSSSYLVSMKLGSDVSQPVSEQDLRHYEHVAMGILLKLVRFHC